MKVVADASVIIAVAMNEPERSWVIEATRSVEAVAPQSLPFEIANALTRLVKQGLLSAEHAQAAWEATAAIPVSLCAIDIAGALRLSCAQDIYAYDGFMLQCALETSASLLTLDRTLKRTARDLGIELVE